MFFDFNHPENIPDAERNTYDMLVLDPPFVTREVWEKYAECISLLLINDGQGKIVLSTLDENEGFIKELTGCTKKTFRPYISSLIY